MKKMYGIPVVWQMWGRVWVEAEDEAEAIEYVLGHDCPLPEGSYIDESFQVDEGGEFIVRETGGCPDDKK